MLIKHYGWKPFIYCTMKTLNIFCEMNFLFAVNIGYWWQFVWLSFLQFSSCFYFSSLNLIPLKVLSDIKKSNREKIYFPVGISLEGLLKHLKQAPYVLKSKKHAWHELNSNEYMQNRGLELEDWRSIRAV